MRINWDTPIEELYHSNNIAYIDLDEDEICHWKYIKREKLPNGKWRYFYDQSELDAMRDEYKTAQSNAWRAGAEWGNAKGETKKAYENKKKADTDHNFSRGLDEARKTYNAKQRASADYLKAKSAEYAAEQRSHSAYAEYQKLEKKYNTKKIVSFPARTVAKGAVKVANFLSGANKKSKIKKPKKKKVSRVTYSSSVSLKSAR